MKKIINIELSSIVLCITLTFYSGTTLNILKDSIGIDSWISVILSHVIGLLFIGITLHISKYKPNIALQGKAKRLFTNMFGNAINIFMYLIFALIGITILYSITNFITVQYLYHTPPILTSFALISVAVYCSKKGINTITHISFILTTMNIFLFLLSSISIIGEIKLDNLLPVLTTDITKIIYYAIKIACINTLPIIIILTIPKENIQNKEKYAKSIIIAYILGSIISTLIVITTISVLGIYLTKTFEFSEYMVLKKVKLFGFLERSENILSMQWITQSYIYITLIIYSISKQITTNKTKFNLANIIIGILFIIASNILFKNTTIFNNYIKTTFITITSLLIIPYILLALKILIEKRKKYH